MGNKKGRFIVGTHAETPAAGARTEDAGWERHLSEEVEYTDRLRKRHWEVATYILNLDTLTFEKNRVDAFTVQVCLQHLQKHFPEQYPQWMKTIKTDING